MDKAELGAIRRKIRRVLAENHGKFILIGENQGLVEEIGRLQSRSNLSVKAFGKLIGLSASQAGYVNEKFKGQRPLKGRTPHSLQKPARPAPVPKFSEIRISGSDPVEVRTPSGYVLKFATAALAAEFIRQCERS